MKYNTLVEADIKVLAASPILAELRDVTILVTGATGLLGGQCVLTLLELNRSRQANIRLVALVRDRQKAKKLFAPFLEDCGLEILEGDILSSFSVEGDLDYILHGASATDSAFFVQRPADTISIAVRGTENILELARKKGVRGLVYLSSLEVYGVTDPSLSAVSETDYGYLDPVSVRSSYSESKRLAETLCVAYAHQYDLPVKIARLTQTFGPGVDYGDNRVFAQFARAVIEGQDIVLRTKGETVRNYCYSRDAIQALFYILLRGAAGQAYNVANPASGLSIREMAQLILDLGASPSSKLAFDLADDVTQLGYNPTVKIQLKTDKLEGLGWRAEVGLQEMFRRLLTSLRLDREGR
ncbi:NAD-dependent epimerase/dehydratase family protein [Streptococcus anginosus]|uniref:NAD-dependent epimerase/dehydratase family protein n=1 Tax=Streptococcus anginosus TaxID=1328 RepID=UPI000D042D38|nr:NAD-dependent epimerase/dehydratase family protein [Streptococcus anginosus]PRT76737.1 nucleotide sugar dehydratase [Streptococcus anginosus]